MKLEDHPIHADTGEEECGHGLLGGHHIGTRMDRATLRAISELRGQPSFESGTSRIQYFEIY